jgi:hypothetical protein
MSARALACSYAALWLATIAGAGLAAVGARLHTVGVPRPALEPTLATVGELLAHNAVVALWPLALVAVGWPALAGVRVVADALIAAQLLAHGLLVGSALGQHPQIWRYLPHLPVEWLGLAIPAGAWLTARHPRPGRPDPVTAKRTLVLPAAAAGLAALAGAAAIETYLAPVR